MTPFEAWLKSQIESGKPVDPESAWMAGMKRAEKAEDSTITLYAQTVDLREQRDLARAEAAVMREALEHIKSVAHDSTKADTIARKALASTPQSAERLKAWEEMEEVLESIAAEKCKPSFEEQLSKLERGALISIIDTDTKLARDALAQARAVRGGG